MSDAPTAKTMEALWALLATGGQGKRPAKGADDLVAGGYIQMGYRAGSKIALAEVTDKGWKWAHDHFGDPASTPKALLPWFSQIKAYLLARDLTLADLVVAPPVPLSPEPVKAAKPKAPSKPRAPRKAKVPAGATKTATPAQIRKRIEAAYLAVTDGRKNEAVPLSRMREALAELDRAALDAGLARILAGDRKARLSQISDPKAISAAEHAAAFSPAGEPFHLLWIHA